MAIALFGRLFFGVDFTDEAMYVADAALPWLGGRHFEHELFLQQMGSLPWSPLVGLYFYFRGSPDGVILFVRVLYFLAVLLSSWHVATFLKESGVGALRWIMASLILAFIPASIPSLSYNSLSYLGLLNFCLAGSRFVNKPRLALGILAGLTAALATGTYLTMIVPSLLGLLILFLLTPKQFSPALRLSPVGAFLTALLPLLVYLSLRGWPHVIEAYFFSRHFAAGDVFSLIDRSVRIFIDVFPPWWLFILLPLLCRFAPAKWQGLAVAASFAALLGVFAAVTLPLLAPSSAVLINHYLLITWGLAVVFFMTITFPDLLRRHDRFFLGLLVLTGFLASITSANAIFSTAYAATIVTLLFFGKIPMPRSVQFGLIALLVISCGLLSGFYPYRDRRLDELTEQITAGPYAGLWTTRARAQLLKQLDEDLRAFPTSHRVLFFDSFPAGYLLSFREPATLSLFMQIPPFGLSSRPLFLTYFEDPQNRPDLVFQFKALEFDERGLVSIQIQGLHDPLRHYFAGREDYDVVASRPQYDIYRRRSPATSVQSVPPLPAPAPLPPPAR